MPLGLFVLGIGSVAWGGGWDPPALNGPDASGRSAGFGLEQLVLALASSALFDH
jgi:hypothetical protein